MGTTQYLKIDQTCSLLVINIGHSTIIVRYFRKENSSHSGEITTGAGIYK